MNLYCLGRSSDFPDLAPSLSIREKWLFCQKSAFSQMRKGLQQRGLSQIFTGFPIKAAQTKHGLLPRQCKDKDRERATKSEISFGDKATFAIGIQILATDDAGGALLENNCWFA